MRENIAVGEIYHVFSRGVDRRIIFTDNSDYLRFIHNLFEFNDIDPVSNTGHYFSGSKHIDIASRYINPHIITERKPRKLLVDILVFTLMPNHYHLLLKSRFEDGVFKFLRKLNIGYAKYFNIKHDRKGTLFESRYKSILVKKESHLIHLPYYIHANPLDLVMPEWRDRKVRNYKRAIYFLENYRWSSLSDYLGKQNFPSVTQRDFLLEFFGGPDQHRKDMISWLKEMDLNRFKEVSLE